LKSGIGVVVSPQCAKVGHTLFNDSFVFQGELRNTICEQLDDTESRRGDERERIAPPASRG
jgi:hypothetical protein